MANLVQSWNSKTEVRPLEDGLVEVTLVATDGEVVKITMTASSAADITREAALLPETSAS